MTVDQAVLHPLTPVSASELEEATTLLKNERSFDEDWRFVSVILDEPVKAELRDWPAVVPPRRVNIVVHHRPTATVHEALVNLTTSEVEEWRPVPGVQPRIIYGEWEDISP